jgi:hypothetical protein
VQETVVVVKPQGAGNTEENLSFDEKMRRERLRDASVGVTEYFWCVCGRLVEVGGGREG